jgi:hypothetical protein
MQAFSVVLLPLLAWQLAFFRPGAEACCGPRHPHVLAVNGSELELAPSFDLAAGDAILDGRRLDTPDALRADLAVHTRNWAILHPREPDPRTLLVDADPHTPWGALRPWLLAAAIADHPHLSFVVEVAEPDAIALSQFARVRSEPPRCRE